MMVVLIKAAAQGMVKGGQIMNTQKTELTGFADKSRDEPKEPQGYRLSDWTVQITALCDTGRKAGGLWESRVWFEVC